MKTVWEIYNNIEKDFKKRLASSPEAVDAINELNDEELKRFRSRVFDHYLSLPENQLVLEEEVNIPSKPIYGFGGAKVDTPAVYRPAKTRRVEFSEIEPFVLGQKPQGFWSRVGDDLSNVGKAWKAGNFYSEGGWNDIAQNIINGGTPEEREALFKNYLDWESKNQMPENKSWVGDVVNGVANLVPLTVDMLPEAATVGAATAAGGAALGSVVPGAGTFAGALGGLKLGVGSSMAEQSYKVGVADIYTSLRKDGVDDETAREKALKWGALYGALEYTGKAIAPIQRKILGGKILKEVIDRTVDKNVKNKIAAAAAKHGIDVLTTGTLESAIEGGQGGITELARQGAKGKGYDVGKVASATWDEAAQAAPAMFGMAALGVPLEAATNFRAKRLQKDLENVQNAVEEGRKVIEVPAGVKNGEVFTGSDGKAYKNVDGIAQPYVVKIKPEVSDTDNLDADAESDPYGKPAEKPTDKNAQPTEAEQAIYQQELQDELARLNAEYNKIVSNANTDDSSTKTYSLAENDYAKMTDAELVEAHRKAFDANDVSAGKAIAEEWMRRRGYETQAYHGTGADDFNVADATSKYEAYGEGNQAHGSGLYMAASRDTAESYKYNAPIRESRTIGGKTFEEIGISPKELNYPVFGLVNFLHSNGVEKAKEIINRRIESQTKRLKSAEKHLPESKDGFDRDLALETIRSAKKEISNDRITLDVIDKILSKLKKSGLSISDYEYKISEGRVFDWFHNMKPDELLDEDKFLSDQDPKLQKKIIKVYRELERKAPYYKAMKKAGLWADYDKKELAESTEDGRDFYRYVVDALKSRKEANALLLKHGIRGITYDGRQDGRAFVSFEGGPAVKLQDPFTFDDSGNYIPLDQRGNSTNPDMRYSIAESSKYDNFRRDLHNVSRLSRYDMEKARVKVGQCPAVFKLIGFEDKPLYMSGKVVWKSMYEKEKGRYIAEETLGKIGEAIENPLFIEQSVTKDNAILVHTELEHKGEKLAIAIHLSRKEDGYVIHKITSVYSRSQSQKDRAFDEGRLLYLNTERGLPELNGSRASIASPSNLKDLFVGGKIRTQKELSQYNSRSGNTQLSVLKESEISPASQAKFLRIKDKIDSIQKDFNRKAKVKVNPKMTEASAETTEASHIKDLSHQGTVPLPEANGPTSKDSAIPDSRRLSMNAESEISRESQAKIDEIKAAVEGVRAKFNRKAKVKSDISVVGTLEEAREKLGADSIPYNARAVQDKEKVVIIAENIADADEAVRIFLHEQVGHWGLRKLLKADLKPFLNYIITHYQDSNAWKRVAKYYKDVTKNKYAIAEEVLAHVAENRELSDPSMWKRLVHKVKRELWGNGVPQEYVNLLNEDVLRSAIALSREWAKGDHYLNANGIWAKIDSAPKGRDVPDDEKQGRFSLNERPTDAEIAEARRQKGEVKAKWINPDGKRKKGYHCAPNGKPSKLSEEQWLLVRTPNFKKWFGDWEKEAWAKAAMDFLEKTAPVANLTGHEFQKDGVRLTDKVSAYFKSLGNIAHNEELGDVILDLKGVEDSIAHGVGRLKSAAFMAVPKVIEKGFIFNRENNWKERGWDTAVIVAPVRLGGDDYICEVVAKKVRGKQRFYLHEVEIKKTLDGVFKSVANNGNASQVSRLIIGKHIAEVKGKVSQVVDENGEPMVVYHGTPKFDRFNIFKKGSGGYLGPAIYFTNLKAYAQKYENKWGEGGNLYDVFLSLRNPLVVKSINPAKEILKTIYGKDGIYDKRSQKQSDDTMILSSADIKKLQSKGYDGVIWEYGGSKEYAVYNSNQIKSATDNIGSFSTNNPDIRYSISEDDAAEEPLTDREKKNIEAFKRNIQNGSSRLDISENDAYKQSGLNCNRIVVRKSVMEQAEKLGIDPEQIPYALLRPVAIPRENKFIKQIRILTSLTGKQDKQVCFQGKKGEGNLFVLDDILGYRQESIPNLLNEDMRFINEKKARLLVRGESQNPTHIDKPNEPSDIQASEYSRPSQAKYSKKLESVMGTAEERFDGKKDKVVYSLRQMGLDVTEDKRAEKNSQYVDVHLDNGSTIYVRVSNHPAKTRIDVSIERDWKAGTRFIYEQADRGDWGTVANPHWQGDARLRFSLKEEPPENDKEYRQKRAREEIQSKAGRAVQAAVDAFAPLATLERVLYGDVRGAEKSAWKMALMTRNLDQVMFHVLRVGGIKYNKADGSFVKREGTKGLEEILKPVKGGNYKNFEHYAKAKSAIERWGFLRKTNFFAGADFYKTFGFSLEDAKKWVAEGSEASKKAFGELQVFFQGQRDFMLETGLISPEQHAALSRFKNYVPFFREGADLDAETEAAYERFSEIFPAGKGFSGRNSGVEKFEGSARRTKNLVENIVNQSRKVMDSGYKNIAAYRSLNLMRELDMAKYVRSDSVDAQVKIAEMRRALEAEGIEVGDISDEELLKKVPVEAYLKITDDSNDNIVSVRVNGTLRFYKVEDPELLVAVKNFGAEKVNVMWKLLTAPKNIMTQAITKTPEFAIRNFIRDTGSNTILFGGKTIAPYLAHTAKNAVKSAWNTADMQKVWAAGAGGGAWYSVKAEDIAADFKDGGKIQKIGKYTIKPLKWLLNEYERRILMPSEQGNRISVMQKALENGASDMEAAFQYLDVMNFGMRGSGVWTGKNEWAKGAFTALHAIIRITPFLNARIQGLYKLWRESGAQQAKFKAGEEFALKERTRAFIQSLSKAVLLRGMMLASASMLYSLYANSSTDDDGDKWFEKLPAHDKLNYWHIYLGNNNILRIPKPFEIGYIFGTIPEAITDALIQKRPQTAKVLWEGLTSQLEFDPLSNPVIDTAREQYWNKDSFTKRPIIQQSDKDLKPRYQYDPDTSATAKAVARVFEGVGLDDSWLASPARIQNVIGNFLGGMTKYITAASDVIVESLTDIEGGTSRYARESATKRVYDWAVRNTKTMSTRNAEDYYELRNRVREIYGAVRVLRQEKRLEECQNLIDEHKGELGNYNLIEAVNTRLGEISRKRKALGADRTLSTEELIRADDELLAERNRLLADVDILIDRVEKGDFNARDMRDILKRIRNADREKRDSKKARARLRELANMR